MPHPKFADLWESRRNNFDFLRFFLATLVIFSHSYAMVWGTDHLEPLNRLSHGKHNLASLAVAFFFAISGFLISQSWERSRSFWDYWRKRLLRIYPGWIAALLFCLFVVAPISRPDHSYRLADPDTYAFLDQLILRHNGSVKIIPGIFPHTSQGPFPLGPAWTIPYELLCYALLSFLGLTRILRNRWLVLGLFGLLFLWTFSPACPHPLRVSDHYLGELTHFGELACYFLSGAIFYLFRDRIALSRAGLGLAALVYSGFTFTRWTSPLIQPYFLYNLILITCGCYLLFGAALSPRLPFQNFGKYGDFSYGLYLYAWPVQQLLVQYAGNHLTPLLLFLCAFPLSLGLAVLSWRLIERPFLGLKRPVVHSAPPPNEDEVKAPAKGPVHWDHLDGIRGLAALWVVGIHAFGGLPELYAGQGWKALAFYWVNFGHLAVGIFIVLSGYCLTLPVRKTGILAKGAVDFYRRRAWRILPPYFAAIALGVLMCDFANRLPIQDAWKHGLGINLLMLQDILRSNAMDVNVFDPPTWTVAVEWKIYFLFPLFLLLLRRRGGVVMMLLTAALVSGFGVAAFRALRPGVLLDHLCPWYVLLFAMGAAAAWLQGHAPAAGSLQRVRVLRAILFALVCALIVHPGDWGWVYYPVIHIIAGALVALCLYHTGVKIDRQEPSRLARLFSWRPLVKLGVFGYSLYLAHMPFLWLIYQTMHAPPFTPLLSWPPDRWALLFGVIAVPISVALSYGFYLAVEKPVMDRRRRHSAGAPTPGRSGSSGTMPVRV